jgi:hypothetical protein
MADAQKLRPWAPGSALRRAALPTNRMCREHPMRISFQY